MFDVGRTLALVKENITLSTFHCVMALMTTHTSKFSDRYVTVIFHSSFSA